jgi:hypothetical protein
MLDVDTGVFVPSFGLNVRLLEPFLDRYWMTRSSSMFEHKFHDIPSNLSYDAVMNQCEKVTKS